MFDTIVNLLFFNLYGTVVFLIALFGALPYGIWQGLKKVRNRLWRTPHGNV